MTAFSFRPLVNDPSADIISAALGNNTDQFDTVDVGQAVKLDSTGSTYVQCADGDEMEGFVISVEPFNVNSGFSFGSVQRDKRVKAQVAANEGGTLAIGDHLVIGTPIALGTASGYPQVKAGVAAAQDGTTPFAYTERTPNTFIWRVIEILTGTGVAGDLVLIERV